MAAITDLAAASSVAAADNLVINQSGTDKKVTADKFAVVGNTNTFSAIQTFSAAVNAGLINNAADTNVANNGTYTFTYSAAIVMIHDRSSGAAGMYLLRGGATSVVELLDSGNLFTPTKDTASSWNIYYESGVYKLQNKIGSSRAVHIWEFA